ncbi:AAA ATPase [Pacmanvirus A23]|uniref:AAA ATPase n=1 Tax=Pacmanvirus A23 TaxID=1932881 RepID=UPI000A094C40|nr:AAA ATPase [Pacmanvirus A23]SIP85919.1 AAA ATPase [Pacmanvirus A23]
MNELIFVCGRGGSGKTTYATTLGKLLGYPVISIDEVIRTQMTEFSDKFSVYQPNASLIIRRCLVLKLRKLIVGSVILEGSIKNPDLILDIADGEQFSVRYIIPANFEVFRQGCESRYKHDLAMQTETLGFLWYGLSRGLTLDEAIEEGYKMVRSHLKFLNVIPNIEVIENTH